MTQCNPCNTMKPLARCMAELTVGNIADFLEPVWVYILNNTTGVRVRFDVTSDAAGLVVVDLTDYPQIEGHDYELWITKQDATNPEDRETVTINSVEYTCFAISFIDILEDGAIVTGEDQTLEAA